MESKDENQKLEAFYQELDQLTKNTNDPEVNYRDFVFFDDGTPYVSNYVEKIMNVYVKHFR